MRTSHFLLFLLCIFLASPQCPSQYMTPHKITYKVQLLPPAGYNPDAPSASDLYFQANVPEQFTIHWNGRKSLTEATGTDYGIRGYQAARRETDSESAVYFKDFDLLKASWKVEEEGESDSEFSPAAFELTGRKKTLLGQEVEEGILLAHGKRELLWFARGLEHPDPTGALPGDAKVPGLVLECEELAGEAHWRKSWVAVDLHLNVPLPPENWTGNADFGTYAGLTEVRAALAEAVHKGSGNDLPAAAEGPFSCLVGGEKMSLEVMEGGQGAAPYLVKQWSDEGGEVREANAWLHGNTLFVEQTPNWERFTWSAEDSEWQHAEYPFLRYSASD